MQAQLLMVRDDDRSPALSGLTLDALQQSLPEHVEEKAFAHFHDIGGDPDDLAKQQWGVVAPEGSRGDVLLGYIQLLIQAREAEQGRGAQIYRVPPRASLTQAREWKRQVLQRVSCELGPPRYLLLLGDLHEVPLEIQLALNGECFVGRIAFTEDSSYATYAAKVLHWERVARRPAGRLLFFTAHDATLATSIGYRGLMEPTFQRCRECRDRGSFHAQEIIEVGDCLSWGRGHLLSQAGTPVPSALFSMSHGIGAPLRGGWSSDEEQRRLQGAMSLGAESLEASHVEEGRFLPGGFWLNVSCFGAGTPSQSSYFPWLKRLRENSLFHEPLETVQASLARSAPFVCALPQAALANPEGPLAMIGHVDLAWTFAYSERYGGNPSHFTDVLRLVMAGRRVGLAIHALGHAAASLYADLGAQAQELEYARAWNLPPPVPSQPQPFVWMTCNDLSGYILLGDPAVRLPLRRPEAGPRASRGRRPRRT